MSSSEPEKSSESEKQVNPLDPDSEINEYKDLIFEDLELGVWSVKRVSPEGIGKQLKEFKLAIPLFRKLITDIFNVAPGRFSMYIICQLWEGIEDSLLMHFSNKILNNLETGLIHGKIDKKKIIYAIFARFACIAIVESFKWYKSKTHVILKSLVTRHFQIVLMKANLKIDLPTSQELGSRQDVSADDAWRSLENIFDFSTNMVQVGSQLLFLINLSRKSSPFSAILAMCQPLFLTFMGRSLYESPFFSYVTNVHHRRMETLRTLAGGMYRQDIISGHLATWITSEYQKAHEQLGGSSDADADTIFDHRATPFFDICYRSLGDLPMAVYILKALANPKSSSLSSLANLQQSTDILSTSILWAIYESKRVRSSISSLRSIYSSSNVVNQMKSGDVYYPRKDDDAFDSSKGMSLELKNVSFSYPASQKTTPALDNVCLNICAGQLCIIVGANGSGKSTLIKILSRMYDPSSGGVLIDGLPSSTYRVDDLRDATVLLSQDSYIYPVSLAENIGLGYCDRVDDEEMILDSAKQGGALDFINKLKDRLNTVLHPVVQNNSHGLYSDTSHPLYKIMKETVPKDIDVSGGEKQRLIASRAFMKFKSGKVKFVVVDEPSSALDAEAELQLFENLISVREGKTVIFVTHRFGHLTKHANLIVCMKDGSIAEMGSHTELMEKNGEYATLYNIQAQAFSQA